MKSLPNQTQVSRQNSSFLGSESHCHEEIYQEFECFKLIESVGGLQVKTRCHELIVIIVLFQLDILEHHMHFLNEIHAKYCFAEPELLVFTQNHIVNYGRDLRLYFFVLILIAFLVLLQLILGRQAANFYIIHYLVHFGNVVDLASIVN